MILFLSNIFGITYHSAWSSAYWLFIWLSLSTMYFHRIRTTFLLCPLLSGMFLFTFFCHWKPRSMRKYTPYYTTILFCLNGNQSQHLESMVLYKLCCKFLRKYCSSLSRFELYLVDCWINIISFFFFFFSVKLKSPINIVRWLKSLSPLDSLAEHQIFELHH